MADAARDMEGVKASNQSSGGDPKLERKGNDINSSSSNQPSPSASSFDDGALPDHDPPPTENGLTVGTVSKEEIDKYKIYRYNKPKLKLGVGDAEAKRQRRMVKYNSYTIESKLKSSLMNWLRWSKEN